MKKLLSNLKRWRFARWMAAVKFVFVIIFLGLQMWAGAINSLGWVVCFLFMDLLLGDNKRLSESRDKWIDWGTEALDAAKATSDIHNQWLTKAKDVYSREYNTKTRAALREIFGADTFNDKAK